MRLVACIPLVALAACSSSPPVPTGFLSDYSRLDEISDNSYMFVDEPALREAKAFLIHPVEIHFHEGANEKNANWAALNELRVYMHGAITEAIEDRYVVTRQRGAGVARVRIALTDVGKVKALKKLLPAGILLGGGRGGLSVEAEVVDNRTGNQIAAIIEEQDGRRLPLDGLGELSDAKAIIDDWAARFRARLDAVNGH